MFSSTPKHTTNAVIELHYLALWGSHYSLWLICNDWLSPTSRAQMDPLIDYTQTKTKIQWSNTMLIMRNYLHSPFTSRQYRSLYNPIYVFQHTSSPSEEYAIDQAWMCAHTCVFMCVCVSCGRTALSLFLHTNPALIGFGLGTHIPAVLEIHQPWQVYCTTTLHRLWPTTRTKISLSIRKTFMSRDGGGFETIAAAGGTPGCWFKFFAWKIITFSFSDNRVTKVTCLT